MSHGENARGRACGDDGTAGRNSGCSRGRRDDGLRHGAEHRPGPDQGPGLEPVPRQGHHLRRLHPRLPPRARRQDAGLVGDSAWQHGLDLPLLELVARRLGEGAREHGDKDFSATYLTSAQNTRHESVDPSRLPPRGGNNAEKQEERSAQAGGAAGHAAALVEGGPGDVQEAHDRAVQTYGGGDQASRVAYAELKKKFEKRAITGSRRMTRGPSTMAGLRTRGAAGCEQDLCRWLNSAMGDRCEMSLRRCGPVLIVSV